MGNQRQYNPQCGFSQYLYVSLPEWATVEINGLRGKVVREVTSPDPSHTRLPTYSNTSDFYFKLGADGQIIQARLYIKRTSCLDFDWGHDHKNKQGNKMSFPKGVVHVQPYSVNEKDEVIRMSNEARLMTDEEIEKYGPIIHHFAPEVKFRP